LAVADAAVLVDVVDGRIRKPGSLCAGRETYPAPFVVDKCKRIAHPHRAEVNASEYFSVVEASRGAACVCKDSQDPEWDGGG